jgi:hypothetical protein
MSPVETHLHVIRAPRAPAEEIPQELDDVGLTLFLFLVAAFPLASAIAGVGRWSQASLGLGTLGVLLAGRELGARALARWRKRRRA